jgi:DNA invertase Pin-like site-specific DNA recombinase
MDKKINNNMNDFTKKVEEVALYIRVSTEEQAINGDSLRTQREALTKFALANHYHIYGIYEDDGFSATNLNRPALQRLLEDVRKNKINRILLTKLDRLSRGVRNYYKVLDVLDAHCVFWQTIFEKYDSSTASGRLHINIMLSVAENESAQTSERIRSVFNNKIHQKEIISGKIPIGYKKEEKKLVVDEDKKALVIDAFNFYLKSGSVYKTFEYLALFDPSINYPRTARLLANPLYIGTKVCKYGSIENYCEPIISKETFDEVQNLLKKNQRKRDNSDHEFLFSGLLRCNECGYKMSGKYCKNFPTNCTFYYLCSNARLKKKCNMLKQLNETKIEKKLLEQIVPEINKYIDKNNILEQEKAQIRDISKERDKVNKQLEKLRDLYVNDLIQIDHYEKQYKELTSKLDSLKEEEKPVEEKKTVNYDEFKSFLSRDFVSLYNNLSRTEKRLIWASVIDTIYIDDNYNLRIVFI